MFTYAKQQWELGKRIYGYHSWREKRRIFLFTARSYKNKSQLKQLEAYFEHYHSYPNLLQEQEGIWEIINRVFFYKESTAQERLTCITQHFDMLPKYVTDDAIRSLYSPSESGIQLWHSEELALEATLQYMPGQRKEGLLSLLLTYEGDGIYHINFRLGVDPSGQPCIWVGTIQGYKEGLEKAKKLTKKMHGYRPKNFMFFLLRQLATCLGIETLYAVSDEGFYTNTHLIRFNRHKLVKFDDFWEELGGHVWDKDSRFFVIPLTEERKTYETAKTHKRNMYRKRYEMLDTFIEEIQQQGKTFLRNQ